MQNAGDLIAKGFKPLHQAFYPSGKSVVCDDRWDRREQPHSRCDQGLRDTRATEAKVAWLMLARDRNEFMMPQTVPNKPI